MLNDGQNFVNFNLCVCVCTYILERERERVFLLDILTFEEIPVLS
jgi:hypothetical protein